MTAKFITVEGIEGAGKTTQLMFIQHFLARHAIPHVITREPGGTSLGEQIRSLLLTPVEQPMAVDTELLLMFAARAEHVAQVIQPALLHGKWVISDRFVDASYAYQGGGRGVDMARIDALSQWTLRDLQPDLTFLFDLPVELGQERVNKRNQGRDRFEQEKIAFFEKVRHCYLARAQQEPQRIKVIDAAQPIDRVQAQLAELLQTLVT